MAQLHDASDHLIPSRLSVAIDISINACKDDADIEVKSSNEINTHHDPPPMQNHHVIQSEIEGPTIVGRVVSDPHSAALAVQRY